MGVGGRSEKENANNISVFDGDIIVISNMADKELKILVFV
jgi:hypothetical protein